MKMWDELDDPNSNDAMRRKNTEHWFRSKLPLPEHGVTIKSLHAELLEENRRWQKTKGIAPYYAKVLFLVELIWVLDGESLLEPMFKGPQGPGGRRKKDIVGAWPLGGGPKYIEKPVTQSSQDRADWLMSETVRKKFRLEPCESVPNWAWRAYFEHKNLEDLTPKDMR